MPRLILTLTFTLLGPALAAAQSDATPDAEGWQPTNARRSDVTQAVFEAPQELLVVPAESADDLPLVAPPEDPTTHELTTSDEVLGDPVDVQTSEIVEPVYGRGRNDPGWYSRPEWHGMTWRPEGGDRFGGFIWEGQSADAWDAVEGLSSTSGTGFHFLSGPTRTDMPPRLFDFTWGLHWFGEVTTAWWLDTAISAGLHTDFEDSAREGWRFPAHAVVSHEYTVETTLVGGIRYFDRADLGLLPVGGVILRPSSDLRLELVFPEPRAAWRVATDEKSDHWLSVGAQIGGGEWAIEREPSGLKDVVTYNEYELVAGLETVGRDGSINAIEIGCAFGRDLEYRSNVGNYRPNDTFFIRLSSRQ